MRNNKQESNTQGEMAKSSEVKKSNPNDKETMVYLGPSFQGLIQKGVVLEQGVSPKVQTLITNNSFLKGLFIPIHELAKKRKELQKKGSEMQQLYQKAEKIKEDNYV